MAIAAKSRQRTTPIQNGSGSNKGTLSIASGDSISIVAFAAQQTSILGIQTTEGNSIGTLEEAGTGALVKPPPTIIGFSGAPDVANATEFVGIMQITISPTVWVKSSSS
jgi:hypothetical protein